MYDNAHAVLHFLTAKIKTNQRHPWTVDPDHLLKNRLEIEIMSVTQLSDRSLHTHKNLRQASHFTAGINQS
jgi:hypothetical protein